jgi:hypothetical protein
VPDSKGVSDWVVEGERVSEFAGEVLELADTLRVGDRSGEAEGVEEPQELIVAVCEPS